MPITTARRLIALFLAILAMAGAQPAMAQDFPARPNGPIQDQASIIAPAQEAALDAKLRDYNARTGRAIIVATVSSLNGQPIDVYAQQLGEQWDIGGAETEEGALMLVAPNERDVWITTARGTQVRLTDITIGRIISQSVIPAFRQGDYAGGISAGVDAMIQRLDMDPAQAQAIAEAEAAAAASEGADRSGATIGGAVFWVMMILFFMFVFGRRGGGRRRRYGVGGAVGDIILWNALGSAMGHSRGHGGGFGGGGGGGFGGFGGGGGGFNGGGAGGSW